MIIYVVTGQIFQFVELTINKIERSKEKSAATACDATLHKKKHKLFHEHSLCESDAQ